MRDIKTPFKSLDLVDIVQPYYVAFITDCSAEMIVDLVRAANYLHINPLFDLTCLAVTFFIKVCSINF